MPLGHEHPEAHPAPAEEEALPAKKKGGESTGEDWLWMTDADPALLLKGDDREPGERGKAGRRPGGSGRDGA